MNNRNTVRIALIGIVALAAAVARASDMPAWDVTSTANPQATDDGTWSVTAQAEKNPSLTTALTPMTKGKRFDKATWQWDNGRLAANGNVLIAAPLDKTAQHGPAAVVTFQPRQAGRVQLKLKAALKVQTPDAGQAIATVFVLRDGGAKAEELGVFPTEPRGETKGKAAIALEKEVELKDGDRLAVRVQTRNPGSASAGSSYLTIETLSIRPAADK